MEESRQTTSGTEQEGGQTSVSLKEEERSMWAHLSGAARPAVKRFEKWFWYVVLPVLVAVFLIVCVCFFGEWFAENYHYVFLLLSLACLAYGSYRFLHEEVEISHFSGFGIRQTSPTTLVTEASIIGQYKTRGEGFVVGKKITVSALLYLRDNNLYQQVKALAQGPGFVIIENSEAPETSDRDISDVIGSGELGRAFTNPGVLRIVNCHDDKQTIVLQGDVVFTKEGQIEFGLPLQPILRSHGIRIQGINIAPSYVRHEIYWAKVVGFLAFVAIAVAFLSLFFGFR
jgi:hypothetical protein